MPATGRRAEFCCAAAGIETPLPRRKRSTGRAGGAADGWPGGHTGQLLVAEPGWGTGSIEADWLNGEMTVLLGRLGLPTPVNEVLCQVANRMARDRLPPASGRWTVSTNGACAGAAAQSAVRPH